MSITECDWSKILRHHKTNKQKTLSIWQQTTQLNNNIYTEKKCFSKYMFQIYLKNNCRQLY